MSNHTKSSDSEKFAKGVERVDDALPSGIDRRTFFKAAVAGTFFSLTGFVGGGQEFDQEVDFRIAVDPSPNYAIAFAAQLQGFWEDQGIRPLNVQGGQGSGDTARRIATEEDVLGLGAVTPQMLGIAQDDYNILQCCMTKARAQSGLIYRQDSIGDPYDPEELSGKRITAPDTLDEQMWDIFRQGVGAEDVEVEYAEGATASSMLDQGDIDAIWDSINDYASLQENLDHELGFAPLYTITPMAGYALIVNGSWVEETEDGVEYVTRVVQGYSRAGKWTLLNPEEAVSMMEEEFQALQTQPTESNLAALAAGVAATNATDGVRENGFGYLDEEVMQNTFDHLSEIYDVEAPDVEDVVFREVIDGAELAQFSDDEWQQVDEFAGEYADFYER
jgi:ABC-type nitrate/sulfonate/bicarbonate transport system substrate-binding protein